MKKYFKKYRLFLLSLLLLFTTVFVTDGQSRVEIKPEIVKIGKGWARTSVNATIFRKNSIVSHQDYQYVAWYDSTAHVVVAKRNLNNDRWVCKRIRMKGNVNDAHNVISIMVDGDGYLHLAWDHHNGPLNYCKSTGPEHLSLLNLYL